MASDSLYPPDDQPPDTGLLARPSFAVSGLQQFSKTTTSDPIRKKLAHRSSPRLVISEHTNVFRKKYFPAATRQQWNDWHWQNRNRIRSLADLERIVELTTDERAAIARHSGSLPVGITPYYASLIDPVNPEQGLRKTVIPRLDEFKKTAGEADDPLGEDDHSPVRGLVHRYPDRVLLLVTNFCSVYCRYCTRARMVGAAGERAVKKSDLELAIDYIAATPTIRDVLLSGGDPLSLDDERLDWILSRLRAIPHVEFIRIGSKQPVVEPQRITPALIRVLRKYHPLWMSLHFTHPDELTPEVAQACGRLADAGIPLGSQTVLLKGVNDDPRVMTKLMQGLLRIRVRPYYLYQCDPISGSSHFRTPVQTGVDMIRALRGHTTGYAVPTFVVDAPRGGGKIPLAPDYVEGRDGDDLLLSNYAGDIYRYPDEAPSQGAERVPQKARRSAARGKLSCV
jgi:lysine 2,3-aminomutase